MKIIINNYRFTSAQARGYYAARMSFTTPDPMAEKYCYLFKYEIAIPAGAKTLTLPDNKSIKLLSMTVATPNAEIVKPLQPLYDNFKGNAEFKLRTAK